MSCPDSEYGSLLVSGEVWPVVSYWGIVFSPLSFVDVFDYVLCLTIRDAVSVGVFLWGIASKSGQFICLISGQSTVRGYPLDC